MSSSHGRGVYRQVALSVGAAILIVGLVLTIGIVRGHHVDVQLKREPDVTAALQAWASGLNAPTAFAVVPDGSGRVMVIERAGLVKLLDEEGTLLGPPLLDLRHRVGTIDDGAMVSIAIKADADGSGLRVFLSWTSTTAVLSVGEFRFSKSIEPSDSEPRVVLEVQQETFLHSGGALEFAPDGTLYVSVGDGADVGEQGLEAQSLESLRGKILRIDVDSDLKPYDIPADNPFVGMQEARPEIYAYGLRNPWRMSLNGDDLWVADVGAGFAEEINLIQEGGNYGWPLYEGPWVKPLALARHIVEGRAVELFRDVIVMNFSERARRLGPQASYPRLDGSAIIGGYVVPDSASGRAISGRYLFADFVRGTIYTLGFDQDSAAITPLVTTAGPIVFLGEGPAGEILVVSLTGEIYELVIG